MIERSAPRGARRNLGRETPRFVYRAHMPKRPGALVLAALLVSILRPESAHATPPDLFGFGARSPGLAMTGASHDETYEAAYLNPANLASQRRRSIQFGASAGALELRIDGARSRLEPARGTTIGFTLPLPFGDVLEDRLTLGGGFYTPVNVLMRGDVRFAEIPQWSVLDRSQSLALFVGLGLDLHGVVDGLQLGVGVAALAALVGDLHVQLDETNTFQSVVETQLVATFAPIVGVRFEQPPSMRSSAQAPAQFGIGVVYRHELRADMDLTITITDLPVRLPVLTIGGITQYDPSQVTLEGYFRPIPELRLIANLTTRFWSTYPGPATATSLSSLRAPAPEFQDTFSPRLAIEGTLRDGSVELTLRGGYAWEMSPAPPARMAAQRERSGEPHVVGGAVVQVPTRLLDADRHIITLGLGLAANVTAHERLVLDVFGQAHILADRTHLVGASSDDPSAAPLTTSGFILVGGWSAGLEF